MITRHNFEQHAKDLGANFTQMKYYGSPGWRGRAYFETHEDAKAFTDLCLDSKHVRGTLCLTQANRSLISFH